MDIMIATSTKTRSGQIATRNVVHSKKEAEKRFKEFLNAHGTRVNDFDEITVRFEKG